MAADILGPWEVPKGNVGGKWVQGTAPSSTAFQQWAKRVPSRKAVRGGAGKEGKAGEGPGGPQGRGQQGAGRTQAVKGQGQQRYLGTARSLVHCRLGGFREAVGSRDCLQSRDREVRSGTPHAFGL